MESCSPSYRGCGECSLIWGVLAEICFLTVGNDFFKESFVTFGFHTDVLRRLAVVLQGDLTASELAVVTGPGWESHGFVIRVFSCFGCYTGTLVSDKC